MRVGAARSDITGPLQGPLLMGYAKSSQRARGLHTRLWSRAIALESDTGTRAVVVSLDLSQVNESVRRAVIDRLQARLGNLYADHNVLLAATHTHASLGGLAHDYLYTIATLGFEKDNFENVVSGIVDSIVAAHSSLQFASIGFAENILPQITRNRSMEAFLKNSHASDLPIGVDQRVRQLNFFDVDQSVIALWNLFPIHGTSLSNENRLISGDNKGWAAALVERKFPIVAAFSNGAAGDVSPDPLGRRNEASEWSALEALGVAQATAATELLVQGDELSGPLASALLWVDFPSVQVNFGKYEGQLCQPAIGYSMLAGSEDGPGDLPGLREGIRSGQEQKLPLSTRLAVSILKKIFGLKLRADADCHGDKAVAFHTHKSGKLGSSTRLPLQFLRLGKLLLAALPFEPTTMSGIEIEKLLKERFESHGIESVLVVGYANGYAGYLSTPDEYSLQHYEGASTHFGPLSLPAVLQNFLFLADLWQESGDAVYGLPPQASTAPRWQNSRRKKRDLPYDYLKIGQVLRQPRKTYPLGEVIEVRFRGHRPTLIPFPAPLILSIERWMDGRWQPYLTDVDPETRIEWRPLATSSARDHCLQCIEARISWKSSLQDSPGRYRIQHFGKLKQADGRIHAFKGVTRDFYLQATR